MVVFAERSSMRIALWLHVTGVVVWVGGMFFAHMALRPAAASLPPPVRLPLLATTLAHFFRWAGLAIVVVVASGTWMASAGGGFAAAGTAVHAMTAVGLVMTLVYAYIATSPYRALRAAVATSRWEAGGAAMGTIRRLVALNLALGVATIAIATLGRGTP
jgi:uncharacterized membrane protein